MARGDIGGPGRWLAFAGSIAVSACGGMDRPGDIDTSAFAQRDSAGVTIVESFEPLWRGDDAWTIDPEPAVQIGALSGEPEYQLFQVTGVVRLSDGSIAVATGDPAIKIFDEDGRFVRAWGREGDGPGEFRALRSLQRFDGDTLFVWDSRLRRGTYITPEGGPRSGDPIPRAVPVLGLTRAADGAYMGYVTSLDTADTRSAGHARWTKRLVFRAEASDPPQVDTLVPFHAVERYIANPEPQVARGANPAIEGGVILNLSDIVVGGIVNTVESRFVGLPVAREGFVAHAGDRMFVGSNARVQFEEYRWDGTLVRSIRVPGMDLAISPAVADSLTDWLFDWAEDDVERQRIQGMLDDVGYPDVLPAYEAIHVSSDGHFWLAPYVMNGYESAYSGPRPWTVLDPEGRWLGRVDLPDRFRPMEFGEDYILGVWLDDFDVEYVQKLRIER